MPKCNVNNNTGLPLNTEVNRKPLEPFLFVKNYLFLVIKRFGLKSYCIIAEIHVTEIKKTIFKS